MVENATTLPGQFARAVKLGADQVELRIDGFDDDPATIRDFLSRHGGARSIVTCRTAREGGLFQGGTDEAVSRLIAATRGTGAAVDFEFADWSRSSNIAQKVRLASADSSGGPSRLILSAHLPAWHDADPTVRVSGRMASTPDILAHKIAYHCHDASASFLALDLLREHGERMISIAMGEAGLWTRVLARKLDAFGTFASLDSGKETAPGQVSINDLRDIYRWDSIDRDTRVFGVVGAPVSQSMGPRLFNRWFTQHQINAVYLPLFVPGDRAELHRFLDGCVSREWLHVGGLSVTAPHKVHAMEWVGTGVDRQAASIGAVNTITLRCGRAFGSNTDAYAALDSLLSATGLTRADLADLRIDVLGAGGAARAVVAPLLEFGAHISVYARSVRAAESVAPAGRVQVRRWEDRADAAGEVLINCTSVGMRPRVHDSPMAGISLRDRRIVFDLIYNPLDTRLLADARADGVPALNGLDMFIRQAAMQFELWTGVAADRDSARQWLSDWLAVDDRTRANPA